MTQPTPSTRTPAMSIHFTSMTVGQIAERASKLMDEGVALSNLAAALAEFENATGRKLFVSEADQGVEHVGTPAPVKVQLPADLVAEAEAGPEVVEELPREGFEPDLGLTVSTMGGLVPVEAEPTVDHHPAPEPIKKEEPAIAAPAAAKPARDQEPIKKSAPPPVPAPAPQRADRPWGALSLAARRVVQHLERLPAMFTPAEDLRLVELLTSGHKTPIAAAIMDIPVDQVVARWQAFMCPDVLGENRKPSIDGQQHLLAALRYRKDTANA